MTVRSAIQAALIAACGINLAKFETRPELHKAIVKGVNELTDAEWAALPAAAQDWFNDAADAHKAKKEIAEFPDVEAEEEVKPTSRRRASAEPAETPAAAGEATAVEKLQEGDRVELVTKRGKKYAGEVIENSKRKEYVVVKGDDGEDEIDYDKVDTVSVFHGTATPESTGADDDAANAGPEVGDTVTFKTKRGKVVKGIITELTEDTIVVDKDDDYDLEKIDGDIEIVTKATVAADAKPAAARRGKTEPETPAASTEDGKPKRSSNPAGVSVGSRIRELMAQNPDRTEEDVGKVLEKEKIEFRPPTLKMIYKDCAFMIAALRAEGQMKKAK